MIKILDYVNVEEKAKELGCNVPTYMALLPRNYESANSKDELLHEVYVPVLKKLLISNDIQLTPLEKPGEKFPKIAEHSAEWIGPVIFISAAAISQDPTIVSLTLSIVANYLTDLFKGRTGNNIAKFNIIIPDGEGNYKNVDYEWPVEGIEELKEVVRELNAKR